MGKVSECLICGHDIRVTFYDVGCACSYWILYRGTWLESPRGQGETVDVKKPPGQSQGASNLAATAILRPAQWGSITSPE